MNIPAWIVAAAPLALIACGSEVRDDTDDGGDGAAGPTTSSSSTTSTTGQGGGVSGTSSSDAATSSSTGGGSGGGASLAACDTPGSCTLAPDGCCAPCADPSLDDFVAIHVDALDAHFDAVCPEDAACPPCEPAHDPNLFAYCDTGEGRCVGADLPATELASCGTAKDCTLRAGAGCCEACGEAWDEPWGWVALRTTLEAELELLVCEPGFGCPECGPAEPPPGLVADCVDGVCLPVWLDGTSR